MAKNQEIKNIFPHGGSPHRVTQVLCAEILVKRGFDLKDPRIYKDLLDVKRIPDLVPARWNPNNGTETHWIEIEKTHANLPHLKHLKGFTSVLIIPAIDMRKATWIERKRLELELPE